MLAVPRGTVIAGSFHRRLCTLSEKCGSRVPASGPGAVEAARLRTRGVVVGGAIAAGASGAIGLAAPDRATRVGTYRRRGVGAAGRCDSKTGADAQGGSGGAAEESRRRERGPAACSEET